VRSRMPPPPPPQQQQRRQQTSYPRWRQKQQERELEDERVPYTLPPLLPDPPMSQPSAQPQPQPPETKTETETEADTESDWDNVSEASSPWLRVHPSPPPQDAPAHAASRAQMRLRRVPTSQFYASTARVSVRTGDGADARKRAGSAEEDVGKRRRMGGNSRIE
jgi:hypothetical protein